MPYETCYCDYDYVTRLTRTSHPKAKKFHRCNECNGFIEPGEQYRRSFQVSDEGIYVAKMCGDCNALLDYVEAHLPCFCWYWDFLLENADDAMRDYAWEVPGMGMEYGRLRVRCKRRREKRREAEVLLLQESGGSR